jgi:Mg/Co/Ni transporter MgtE
MRVEDLIEALTSLRPREQRAIIEAVRADRATSKASYKRVSKRQRSNAAERISAILDAMSPEERMKFLTERVK